MFSRRSEVFGRDGRIAHAKPLFGRAALDNSQTHSSSCACMTNMQKSVKLSSNKLIIWIGKAKYRFYLQSFA